MGALLRALASIAAAVVMAAPALAQGYPTKSIKIVVPFGAGGPTDVIARLAGERLGAKWGQQIIIENMAGAGGNTGTGVVAKAPADGYTVLAVSTGFIVNPSLYAKVPYDLKTSFAPVSLFAVSPNVISLHPSVPAKTLAELTALVKASPGKFSYAQPSTGSTPHLIGERYKLQFGLDLATVTFNNASVAITTTMGGHTPIAFTALPAAMPAIKSGALRGIAVLSAKRVAGIPDVPTAAEAGVPDLESYTLTGFVIPAATPKEIVDLWARELKAIAAIPEVAKHIENLGFDPVASTPAEFAKRIDDENAKWADIIQKANIRLQ